MEAPGVRRDAGGFAALGHGRRRTECHERKINSGRQKGLRELFRGRARDREATDEKSTETDKKGLGAFSGAGAPSEWIDPTPRHAVSSTSGSSANGMTHSGSRSMDRATIARSEGGTCSAAN